VLKVENTTSALINTIGKEYKLSDELPDKFKGIIGYTAAIDGETEGVNLVFRSVTGTG
jgi:hypothetical protein